MFNGMLEFLVVLCLCAFVISALVYLAQRGRRWCGTCRYYSRNRFPIICESCRHCCNWAENEERSA